MASIVIKIVPELLSNPDLDIRYVLPDIISKHSEDSVQGDGYDYTQDRQALVIFLATEKIDKAVACIIHIIEQIPVLGNDLRKAVTVAIEKESSYEIVYPTNYQGQFSI